MLKNVLYLLCAIADTDKEKTDQYRKMVEPWNRSHATEGYTNYLKGIAACLVEEQEELYRLMAVKEKCGKTIFAKPADEYPEHLK